MGEVEALLRGLRYRVVPGPGNYLTEFKESIRPQYNAAGGYKTHGVLIRSNGLTMSANLEKMVDVMSAIIRRPVTPEQFLASQNYGGEIKKEPSLADILRSLRFTTAFRDRAWDVTVTSEGYFDQFRTRFSQWADRAKHTATPAAVVLSGAKDERDLIRMIGAIFNVPDSAESFVHDQIHGKMIAPASQTQTGTGQPPQPQPPADHPPQPAPPIAEAPANVQVLPQPKAADNDRFGNTVQPEPEPSKPAAYRPPGLSSKPPESGAKAAPPRQQSKPGDDPPRHPPERAKPHAEPPREPAKPPPEPVRQHPGRSPEPAKPHPEPPPVPDAPRFPSGEESLAPAARQLPFVEVKQDVMASIVEELCLPPGTIIDELVFRIA
jgi:hypothetical protein